jgi:hypothetical protein
MRRSSRRRDELERARALYSVASQRGITIHDKDEIEKRTTARSGATGIAWDMIEGELLM